MGTAKLGREIFDMTFDALDSPAKESAVMVGDNLASDIEGGANYGIATCWYNLGLAGKPETLCTKFRRSESY